MNPKHIVSFSGGKDSTAMLLMMLEKDWPMDDIIFVDTTKEFPSMYDHIKRVENYIGREITKVEIAFDYWLGKHVKTKGKNKGKIGYGWADFRNRWCTGLKREAFVTTANKSKKYNPYHRYGLAGCPNTIEYHGIASDEAHRTKNNKYVDRIIKYPLVEWGITEKQALEYCYAKGFDWDGLYEQFVRVSCFCCPFSRLGELKTVYTKYPKLWQQIKKMDKKSYRKFRADYSLDELEKRFQKECTQLTLCDQ